MDASVQGSFGIKVRHPQPHHDSLPSIASSFSHSSLQECFPPSALTRNSASPYSGTTTVNDQEAVYSSITELCVDTEESQENESSKIPPISLKDTARIVETLISLRLGKLDPTKERRSGVVHRFRFRRSLRRLLLGPLVSSFLNWPSCNVSAFQLPPFRP